MPDERSATGFLVLGLNKVLTRRWSGGPWNSLVSVSPLTADQPDPQTVKRVRSRAPEFPRFSGILMAAGGSTIVHMESMTTTQSVTS